MGGIVRTLMRVFVGFVLACIAAAAVQVLFVETPREIASASGDVAGRTLHVALLSLLTATHFALFSAAFGLIAAGIAEWLSLRTPGYWLAVGTGIALLGFTAQYASEVPGQPSILNNYALQAYLTAGFFGGFVYWLTAGAQSGATHRAAVSETAPPAPAPRIIVEKSDRGGPLKGSLAERLARKRRSEEPKPALEGPPSEAATPAAAAAPPDKAAAGKPGSVASTAPPVATTSVPVTKPAATPGSSKTEKSAARPQGADET